MASLLYCVRVLLLSLVHTAAATEERVGRAVRSARWAVLRSSPTLLSGSVPARLRSGAVSVINFYAQVLSMFVAIYQRIERSILPRRLRAKAGSLASTQASNSLASTRATTSAQRGSTPAKPATDAAVILAEPEEEDLPLGRVADVVQWCSASGLERLFVYDPAGHVKRRATELGRELASRREGRKSTIQRGWSGDVVSVAGASPPATRSPPPRDLHVHLLSGEDAERPLLAAAAAVAAASTAVGEKSGGDGEGAPSAPSPSPCRDALDSALDLAAASTSRPSAWSSKPDVALCYGEHLTLAGFPPWGLAQSEIYPMGPLRHASREGVEEAAARFLSTSQRFGR